MKHLPAAFRSLTTPYVSVFYVIYSITFFLPEARWDFLGDSYLTLETLSNGNLWVLPVVTALSAYDTASLTRAGSLEMITSGRKWRKALLLPAFFAGLGTSIVHVIMTAVLLTMGQVTQPFVGWDRIAFTLLVQCLTFICVALMGAAIGRLLSARTAGFAGFAVVFLLLLATQQYTGGTPWATLHGAASITQIGYVWSLPNQLLRIAQMLLITAMCIVSVVVVKQRLNGNTTATTCATATLSVALLLGFVLPTTPHKVLLDPQPQATECNGFVLQDESELSVCATRESRRHLEFVAAGYDYAYETIAAAGVNLDLFPRTIVEQAKIRVPLPEGSGYYFTPAKRLSYKDISYADDAEMVNIYSNFFMIPPQCFDEGSADPYEMEGGMELLEITGGFTNSLFNKVKPPFSVKQYEDAYKQLLEMCK